MLRAHDQRGHAKRSIDAAPAMFGQIHDDEDITWKKRSHGILQLARVSDRAPHPRKKASEAQSMEIELRAILLMNENSRDKPAFPWP
jgi:hypothetical protein